MARKHKHEEHQNHEAWAIPYGDLVTLLLAFFVVMYAISTVNEGKYRVLSDSINAAFRGTPRSMEPIQIGERSVGSGTDSQVTLTQHQFFQTPQRSIAKIAPLKSSNLTSSGGTGTTDHAFDKTADMVTQEVEAEQRSTIAMRQGLTRVADHVVQAMASLIEEKLVVVRRHDFWVEVEIRTDILFPSGSATLSPKAVEVLEQLANTLAPFPNPMRVEGHTDNRPINTIAFPSNWELSAARAASVVHLFTQRGIAPERLAVIGLGENRPAQSNDTPEGRNANRRVLIVVLGTTGSPEGEYSAERGKEAEAPANANANVAAMAAPVGEVPAAVSATP